MGKSPRVYSLYQVAQAIQRAIDDRAGGRTFWVKAEMVKLNHYPQSGHCHPDLVERQNGRLVAQMRGIIWKTDYRRIQQAFRQIVGTPLADGMEILFLARVMYHPIYGLSLHIKDIDTNFTLGDFERQRQLTLHRLKKEGILERNRQLQLATLPKRWAVISAVTSKGYQDFRAVIDASPYGITYVLLPALLQGEGAVDSIRRQLDAIQRVNHLLDAVAIIRGGGGEVGLRIYDSYELARTIALHPLPVLTGIGHSTNQTVAELVSWKSFITPTDLARYIVNCFDEAVHQINTYQDQLKQLAPHCVQMGSERLRRLGMRIQHYIGNRLTQERNTLRYWIRDFHKNLIHRFNNAKSLLINYPYQLNLRIRPYWQREQQRLRTWHRIVNMASPHHILRRGYTLTRVNGKVVSSIKQLRAGMVVKTIFMDGTSESVVLNTQEKKDEGSNI